MTNSLLAMKDMHKYAFQKGIEQESDQEREILH